MKHKLLILAGVLAVVAVLGGFYGKPVAAQIRGLLVQDVDQPARAPFQWTFGFATADTPDQTVTIPKGYRLVIDYVNAQGDVTPPGVQPEIVLYVPASNSLPQYYLYPQQSAAVPDHFSGSWPVTIYADSLKVGTAYCSTLATPLIFSLSVAISGHLVFVGK
jgi:hypothetical protein